MAETKQKKGSVHVLQGGGRTVALDLGSRNVKLAVLRRRKNGLEVESLDSMPIPFASSRGDVKPETVKETLQLLLQRNRIKDAGVLSIMSRDFVTVSHVELPSADREQIRQMLMFETESYLPFAQERAVTAFDFKPIVPSADAVAETAQEGQENQPAAIMSKVVFAAVRQALIPKFLELHSQKGLKQTAIQVSSFAIYNLYSLLRKEQALPKTEGETLIIEVGARRTEFILVGRDGDLLFTRSIEKGGDELTEYLAQKEGISFEEAEARKVEKWEETCLADYSELLQAADGLCLEVDRTFRHIKNKGLAKNITCVCLSGGSAARPEICRILSAPCGIDTPLYLDGLEVVKTGKKGLFGPAFSSVIGAALAQVDETEIYIDLLPVDVIKLQQQALRRKMMLKLACVAAGAVLLALLCLGAAVWLSNARLASLQQEMFAKKSQISQVKDIKAKNETLQKAVKNIEEVITQKTSWTNVLDHVSSHMGSNMWLTSINVSKDNKLTVEGYSRGSDRLFFEEAMQKDKRFDKVNIDTEKNVTQYGIQLYSFKLTCEVLNDYDYRLRLGGEAAPSDGAKEAKPEEKSVETPQTLASEVKEEPKAESEEASKKDDQEKAGSLMMPPPGREGEAKAGVQGPNSAGRAGAPAPASDQPQEVQSDGTLKMPPLTPGRYVKSGRLMQKKADAAKAAADAKAAEAQAAEAKAREEAQAAEAESRSEEAEARDSEARELAEGREGEGEEAEAQAGEEGDEKAGGMERPEHENGSLEDAAMKAAREAGAGIDENGKLRNSEGPSDEGHDQDEDQDRIRLDSDSEEGERLISGLKTEIVSKEDGQLEGGNEAGEEEK